MEFTDNQFERRGGRNYKARKAEQGEENNDRARGHRSDAGGAGRRNIVV
jgi:hypothetical protein